MLLSDINSMRIASNKFVRNLTAKNKNLRVVDTCNADYYRLELRDVEQNDAKFFKVGKLHRNGEVVNGYTYTVVRANPLFTAIDADGTVWLILDYVESRYSNSQGGSQNQEVIFVKASDVKLSES